MTEPAQPASRRRRSRVRHPGRLALAAAVVVLGGGLAWIVVTGLLARSDTSFLTSHLPTLRSDLTGGDESAATTLAQTMEARAASAHARTTGPAWWVASRLPFLHAPVTSVRAQAAQVDEFADTALPPAVRAGETLDPDKLRTGAHSINLTLLQSAIAPLDQAAAATDAAVRRSQELPGPTWLGAVNRSRDTLLNEVTTLHRSLSDLATAARLLPEPLGLHGTRRYFVAFETDAEARGLGGLPGAYAILTARNGRLRFTEFGSDNELDTAHSHLNLGRAFANRYDADYDPQDVFFNSDSSPNFPDSARIWMAMWQNLHHQQLDGAIATDPTALSYLLGATGPVTLADGSRVGSGNAVEFFENSIYAVFAGDDAARKAYQVQASQAVAAHVLHQPSSQLLATATAMQKAVDEGRLLAYSSDPTVEHSLARLPIGGVLPVTDRPFLDVVVNNSSGTKLDYYLDRQVTYTRASCTSRSVTVTVSLHNTAPDHGLAPTVLGRGPGVRPEPLVGEEGLVLSLYGTHASQVQRVTVNGRRQFIEVSTERGHPVTSAHLQIKSGQTLTLTFHITEPPARGPLLALTQPAVRTQQTTINAPACPTRGTP